MQAILALADALHVTLEAWPMYDEDVEGGLDQDDLVAWYQRLGFRYLPKRDPDSDRYMVRKPRTECQGVQKR